MENVDVVYHCIHKRFIDKIRKTNDRFLRRKEADTIITRTYHFPKALSPVILKEMELLKLIRLENKSEIKVFDMTTDLENTSAMFRKVGIF